MRIGKLLLILLLLTSISGCATIFDVYKPPPPNKLPYRDSLYVVYTLQSWAKVTFDRYSEKDVYNKNDLSFKVLRAFYSPDSLKVICWIDEKLGNGIGCQRPKGGFSFSGSAVAGIRDNTRQTWKIYPLNYIFASCWENENQVMRVLGGFYFIKMKDFPEVVNKMYLDSAYGGKVRYDLVDHHYGDDPFPKIGKNIGYNLQDKDFWTKSLVWQKGARIPNLYNFQTIGAVEPDRKNPELITPKIIYPDSILRLYR